MGTAEPAGEAAKSAAEGEKPKQGSGKLWHAVPAGEALSQFGASESGLSGRDAAARLALFGRNEVPGPSPPSPAEVLLRQFRDPLIYVLGIASLVSLGIGHFADAAFMILVVVIDVGIGATQEWRAERSSLALQRLLRSYSTVLRDGEVIEIDGETLVPGDLVILEPGNRILADIRLLATHGLEIDESTLTGESTAAAKDSAWRGEPDAPLADRLNMAFAGTLVVRGRGRGVVVATGQRTEIGQVARELTAAPAGKPPLLVRMEGFARVVSVLTFAGAALIAVYGVWRGESTLDMVVFGIALAVSVIPEGLPVALTVALAIASRRMARRGVIVRRLAAVEGLGSCTYIGSDKTGTLTANELTVRALLLPDGTRAEITGEGYTPSGEILAGVGANLSAIALASALCNEGDLHARGASWVWRGDPTDVALLVFAHKAGIKVDVAREEWPQQGRIPFEPERRFAATWHTRDGQGLYLVKGAPERVLAMSKLSAAETVAIGRHADALAAEGFRLIAFARAWYSDSHPPAEWTTGEPRSLEFLGLAGLKDPLRAGAKEAVARCRATGITVAMITGDHPVTALAIARELGLASTAAEVVTGSDLARAPEAEQAELVARARVVARVSPEQKLRIVDLAKQAGHFVAVTGDGVNDAPALRGAHVGVAMGLRGTDVAREAASLVIGDDNFATIVSGVEEGRVAYDNVRKVVFLLVSTGAAEILLVACAVFSGLPLPLLAVQILWLNLVTNGIQDVALAFEPHEGDVLARKPRPPGEAVFDRLMIERVVLSALVMGGTTFLVFRYLLAAGWAVDAARNVALMLMVLFEMVQIGNTRSERLSLLRLSPFRNPLLLLGTVLAFLMHLGALYFPPARALLGTAPIEPATLAALAGLSLTTAVAIELHKILRRHPRVQPDRSRP